MNDANNAGTLLPCPFCKKPPGQKVGPPAMVRCITDGCEGKSLGAETPNEWNERAALSTPNAPVEREAIARIIDPSGFDPDDLTYEPFYIDLWRRRALTKADKIAAILAVRFDEAAIRKDEREKQREIDAKIAEHNDRWGEWSKFVVRQQMVPVTAMQTAIASAIRNGAERDRYAEMALKEEDCRKLWQSRALVAEARLAEAMKHIDELTADLGAEIEGRYAGIKLYPSEARRYARDIATVVAARAFTNAAKEKT